VLRCPEYFGTCLVGCRVEENEEGDRLAGEPGRSSRVRAESEERGILIAVKPIGGEFDDAADR